MSLLEAADMSAVEASRGDANKVMREKDNGLFVGLYLQHFLQPGHLPTAGYIKQRHLND